MRVQPKAYIVGVGPGARQHLTTAAVKAIKESSAFLGWKLDLVPAGQLLRGKKVFLQDVRNFNRVAEIAIEDSRRTGKTLAILRIGDPCISSGLPGLLEMLQGFSVRVVPGVSSVQLTASVAGVNIDDSVIVSFHDYGDPEAEKEFMLDSFRAGKHILMLTSSDLRPNEAADYLITNGVSGETPGYVCSNLSLPEESILRSSLREIRAMTSFHWLSTMVVVNPSVPTPLEAKNRWESWRKNLAPRRRS